MGFRLDQASIMPNRQLAVDVLHAFIRAAGISFLRQQALGLGGLVQPHSNFHSVSAYFPDPHTSRRVIPARFSKGISFAIIGRTRFQHWRIAVTIRKHFFLTALLSLACTMTGTATNADDVIDVWLGSSSRQPSKGIYHCTLNTVSGVLSDPVLMAEISGPGFLAMHPKLPRLYAVGTLDGEPSVVAYEITGTLQDASLELLNSLEIGDGGAAHIAVNESGQTLLTAQYGGGSTGVFSLHADGTLKERTQLIDHEPDPNAVPGRQGAPHAHWCGFSPNQKFAFVPDLGLDKVLIYKADVGASKLSLHGAGEIAQGGGPRHMKFHTSGKWIYVLHEIDLKVTVFDYDSALGTMAAKQTIETVPRAALEKEQSKSCSEIRVHPSGRFVYAANRGHDTVTVFRVDDTTGKLKFVEREHVRGATPRNF